MLRGEIDESAHPQSKCIHKATRWFEVGLYDQSNMSSLTNQKHLAAFASLIRVQIWNSDSLCCRIRPGLSTLKKIVCRGKFALVCQWGSSRYRWVLYSRAVLFTHYCSSDFQRTGIATIPSLTARTEPASTRRCSATVFKTASSSKTNLTPSARWVSLR